MLPVSKRTVEKANRSCVYVYTPDGKERGEVRGTRRCSMEGCRGMCLCVAWPDGKRTWPCTHGMFEREDGHWQIRG